MDTNYKKNYLVGVIARLDLASEIPSQPKGLTGELAKIVLSKFPILEPKKIKEENFRFNSKIVMREPTKEITIWRYFGEEREKVLTLGDNYLHIEYKNSFKNIKQLKDDFLPIIEKFYEQFPAMQCSRFGLRFINQIELSEPNPTSWEDYISSKLLSIFTVPVNEFKITRAFHILGLKKDDCNITFQYGMNNPDYPATIKKKAFILDFDAYSRGSLSESDIKNKIDIFYKSIKDQFEDSITEKLRQIMKNGE